MKRFSALLDRLVETKKQETRIVHLAAYFRAVPVEDAAIALDLLTSTKRKRLVQPDVLRAAAFEASELPEWLFERCLETVGDLNEVAALILPDVTGDRSANANGCGVVTEITATGVVENWDHSVSPRGLTWWIENRVRPLEAMPANAQAASLQQSWKALDACERHALNKLVSGSIGVRLPLEVVIGSLSIAFDIPGSVLTYRIDRGLKTDAASFAALTSREQSDDDYCRPYPLVAATELAEQPSELGAVGDWCIAWKHPGIRVQIVRRRGSVFVWSETESLISRSCPEICQWCNGVPDGTVIVGVLSVGQPPYTFVAEDLLESEGVDLRSRPYIERRSKLKSLLQAGMRADTLFDTVHLLRPWTVTAYAPFIGVGVTIVMSTWEDLRASHQISREFAGVEAITMRRREASYHEAWMEWKAPALTIHAVLMYAQPGSGAAAHLYSELTLGVWNEDVLVPVAKTSVGLDPEEAGRVDAFIRANTLERFGVVRNVKPELVFEIAFDGIQPSSRHKSGVTLKSPRITRWLAREPPEQADTLESVKRLLRSQT